VPGLSAIWRAGATTYRALGRLDRACGVASWDEAARFVEDATKDDPLEELQYWGHGRFGRVLVDGRALDASSLRADGPARFFAVVRERSVPGARALLWLRTCEAFGARAGQAFAARLADVLGVRVAGHTHVIGFWQSGLHALVPGATPAWSVEEGVARGTPDAPTAGVWSSPLAPRTIHALEGSVPPAWFDGR
jgi:hypothetical protein